MNLATKQLNPDQKVITALHITPATAPFVQTPEYLITNTNNLSVRACSAASFYFTYYLNFLLLKGLWGETG